MTLVLDDRAGENGADTELADGAPGGDGAPRLGRWRLAVTSIIVATLVVASVALQVDASSAPAELPVTPPAAMFPVNGPSSDAALLADLDMTLAAWGDFGVSGDLSLVAPWFAAAGPQFQQFVAEAPALAANPIGEPGYVMVASAATVTGTGETRTVTADVSMTRSGEAPQHFRWQIEMRLAAPAGPWRVWTVRSVPQVATPV